MGSPQSRAAARARLDQKRRFENNPFSADCELVFTGLPEPDFGGPPGINPPDSIAHYVVPDGSIVEVIRREYDAGKFTAFIHQTWQDGNEYHGDYTVRRLADLKAIARPIRPMGATR